MKTRQAWRAAALLAALMGTNIETGVVSAAPPAGYRRAPGTPTAPRRIVEVPAFPGDHRPLIVDIELLGGDGRLVYPGQPVGFGFRVNRDAFVVIYDIDTEGRTHLLYPRSPWDPEFVRGGVLHHLPAHGAGYRLVADGPPGEEFIVAIASDRPIAARWNGCWSGLAGRSEYDHLDGGPARVGLVRGDRFLAMDRVASRLIDVPVERWDRAIARDYTSFYIGDPACRRGHPSRERGWGSRWHRR